MIKSTKLLSKWDYWKMTTSSGDFWNKRPLEEQLEILEKWYPIESHMIIYYPSGKKTHCIVNSYKLSNYGVSSPHYIISAIMGNREDCLHPGYFMPDIEFSRNQILNGLGV